MKKIMALVVLFLSGCGAFTTGDGTFNGTIVDVHWEGLIWKSCEVDFQLGQQSSSVSSASTTSRKFCDELKTHMGKRVTVKYITWVEPCCLTTESKFWLVELVELE